MVNARITKECQHLKKELVGMLIDPKVIEEGVMKQCNEEFDKIYAKFEFLKQENGKFVEELAKLDVKFSEFSAEFKENCQATNIKI